MKRYTPDFPEMMRLCEMNFSLFTIAPFVTAQ